MEQNPKGVTPADLMQMADASLQMIEIVVGHKAAALEAGFSSEAAEQIAIQFHAMLMASCIANQGNA